MRLVAMATMATMAAIAAGCQAPPASILLCNNANCAPPIDVGRDDTLETLNASLRQTWDGVPTMDGIEIDTVWDPVTKTCLFTHDYEVAEGACDARDAGRAIASFLTDVADLPGRRFYLKLQARLHVGPDGRDADKDQIVAHVECQMDVAELVAAAATSVRRPLTVYFGDEEPVILDAVVASPRWRDEYAIMVKLATSVPEELPIDAVSIGWTEIHSSEYPALRELGDRGIGVQLWTRLVTRDFLQAADYMRPAIIDTNDITIVREWLGPPEVGP